jgi:hypothetical protein
MRQFAVFPAQSTVFVVTLQFILPIIKTGMDMVNQQFT